MNTRAIQRLSITSALSLTLTMGAANAAAYSWTEILIPTIGPLTAFSINDLGQVTVTNAAGSKTGIYRNGIFTPLPASPPGYSKVTAVAINNSGAIVGDANPPSDPAHQQGFILVGSKYVFFSRPGWDNTAARAIAQSGLVTGYSYDDALTTFAGFVYDPATGAFTDATPPGSGTGFSATQGMNADGRISGDGRLAGLGRYAFIWQQGTLVNGTRQLAPFLARFTIGDGGTAARGINDAGFIVGFTASGGSSVGFVGSDSRGFQLLIPPSGDAQGANVACESINNLRQVVCGVTDAAGNSRAFIGAADENDQ